MNKFDKLLASDPVNKLASNGLTDDTGEMCRSYLRPGLFHQLVIKQWLLLEHNAGRWGSKVRKENIALIKDEIAVSLGYNDFKDYYAVIESRGQHCDIDYEDHPRCPDCGYTYCDAQFLMDHRLCKNPNYPSKPDVQTINGF